MANFNTPHNRLTAEHYHSLAASRGFKWLGSGIPKSQEKTLWECGNGHKWSSRYNNLNNGQGCPVCAGTARKTVQDYIDLAIQRGFLWLGPEVTNNRTKTSWQCPQGHVWEACYGDIQSGCGCRYCSHNLPKTLEDYRQLSVIVGYEWIGAKLPNSVTAKTEWRCQNGHVWQASHHAIKRGDGCPVCTGLLPKNPEDYHQLAGSNNLLWLGDIVQNTDIPTRWKCNCGHIWKATYHSIRSGTRCPKCADMVNGSRVSPQQRLVHELTGGELNYPLGNYCLDIALPDDHINIEYDGWPWHRKRKALDAKRDAKVIEIGWRVLRILSGELIPTREQLDAALNHLRNGKTILFITMDDWRGYEE